MIHDCFSKKIFWSSTATFLALLFLCIAALTGCSRDDPEITASKESVHSTKPFLIGLIPERNIFKQLERYEPLARYISKKTGITIELKILTRYGNIAENFVSLNLDGAFLGSFTYTLAHAQLDVDPIARPELADGTSTYYGMIFVRKDSGITGAKDIRGKVFAFVDKATTAGHLLPLAYFKENGINDYRTYLKGFYFAGTHEDVIYDVLNKKADIGAAKNTVYNNIAETDKRLNEELVILKRSPDVPQNTLALKKDIDVILRESIKKAFLTMQNDPEGSNVLKKFGAKRFIETTDNDYDGVYKYIHEIGLQLKTYEYLNE